VIRAQLRTPAPCALLVLMLVLAACGDVPTGAPAPSSAPRASVVAPTQVLPWLTNYLVHPRAPTAREPAVLAGAGDIAACYPGADVRAFRRPGRDHPAAQTARLLDGMPGATVMAVGDNAYEFGSIIDYLFCYHPTWGRHRARTRPATGNHEYLTPGAAGYFAYFGRRGAPPLGYYSYSLGSWHIVVLNSTTQVYTCWPPETNERLPGLPFNPTPAVPGPAAGRACLGDVPQQRWLAADLARDNSVCTAVYFHHPRFSSGPHGNHYQMQRIWDIMYANGVDLVIDGHDHLYERFAPQDPDGRPDAQYGIRQLTVGTGGADFYSLATRQPNSEVLITGVHGVAALALGDGRYSWAFEAVDRSIQDSGSGDCHGAPHIM
jgi:3',5'-cyclic AMP phosphodiesterase CpdA